MAPFSSNKSPEYLAGYREALTQLNAFATISGDTDNERLVEAMLGKPGVSAEGRVALLFSVMVFQRLAATLNEARHFMDDFPGRVPQVGDLTMLATVVRDRMDREARVITQAPKLDVLKGGRG